MTRDIDKKDNLAKAKGLCDYAEKCPAVSRVQMLRKVKTPSGERMKRLDFCKNGYKGKNQGM